MSQSENYNKAAPYLLNVDIKDFFDSISESTIRQFIHRLRLQ